VLIFKLIKIHILKSIKSDDIYLESATFRNRLDRRKGRSRRDMRVRATRFCTLSIKPAGGMNVQTFESKAAAGKCPERKHREREVQFIVNIIIIVLTAVLLCLHGFDCPPWSQFSSRHNPVHHLHTTWPASCPPLHTACKFFYFYPYISVYPPLDLCIWTPNHLHAYAASVYIPPKSATPNRLRHSFDTQAFQQHHTRHSFLQRHTTHP